MNSKLWINLVYKNKIITEKEVEIKPNTNKLTIILEPLEDEIINVEEAYDEEFNKKRKEEEMKEYQAINELEEKNKELAYWERQAKRTERNFDQKNQEMERKRKRKEEEKEQQQELKQLRRLLIKDLKEKEKKRKETRNLEKLFKEANEYKPSKEEKEKQERKEIQINLEPSSDLEEE